MASQGLSRCRKFLAEKNPEAAKRAGHAIGYYFERLETDPGIGRPLGGTPELRELVIPYGNSGYLALYNYDPATDAVFILAFRHQRELGYP